MIRPQSKTYQIWEWDLTKLVEKLFLDCPFSDKDLCKSLGGKWDPVTKKWYVIPRDNITEFYKWLPKGVNFDIFEATNIVLQNSQLWHEVQLKIENFSLYPIDLKRIAQNCVEYVEFGACIQITTASDTEKYAYEFLEKFKNKACEGSHAAIEMLHSNILKRAKLRYEKSYKNINQQ